MSLRNISLKCLQTLGITIASTITFHPNSSVAQTTPSPITPDGTLPNNSRVRLEGNTRTITGGTQAGGNLFHSFKNFSVPTGSEAFFNNNTDIRNIINRVTGGSISNIDGLIRANGSANLFLINPNGIVFGPNARLDIGGSFYGTSANSMKFADGSEFSAVNPQSTPLLTIDLPLGLQYGNNPGKITVGNEQTDPTGDLPTLLEVPTGKTLALVGGDVNVNGQRLRAPGGRIELAGLTSAGTVGLNVDGNNLSLSFPDEVDRGDVFLSNGARVNVRAEDGGNIAVNSRNLEITQGSQLLAGIRSGLGSPEAQAGNIEINAIGTVVIDGVSNGFRSGAFNQVETGGVGNSGRIEIDAGNVEVKNGGQLNSSVLGRGNSGTIRINATDKVVFDGAPSGFQSSAFSQLGENAVGNSGGIEINAGNVEVLDGGYLEANTLGIGDAGKIQITAREKVVFDGDSSLGFLSAAFSQVGENAVGNSGGVEINADNVEVTNGGQLSANTLGTGDAGQIKITAREKVVFDNQSPFGFVSSAFSQVRENAVGNSGGIEINANNVEVTNGGQLSATTLGKGNAGLIRINATDKVVFDGVSPFGVLSSAISQVFVGAEGDSNGIEINGSNVEINGGAQLTATTLGKGNSGKIRITGTQRVVFDGEYTPFAIVSAAISQVFAGAEGNSGGIEINGGNVEITGGAQLTATTLGKGNSGGVFITTESLEVTNGAQVFAQTSGQGMAGNLQINAAKVELSGLGSGLFSRTGGTEDAGTITINTSDLRIIDNAQVGVNNFIETGFESVLLTDAEGRPLTNSFGNPIFSLIPVFEQREGSGNAGTLKISATALQLEDGGGILAQSAGGDGGNIQLMVNDLILLRGNSSISSTAGLQDTGGNGGNIEIDAEFIVAAPNENNDITANAFNGSGGNITITSSGIFGLEERSSALANNTNDIDASSEFGFDGNVEINTPELDPTSALVELPVNLVDASNQISDPCAPGASSFKDRFISTGRGGLPITPTEPLQDTSTLSSWVRLKPQVTSRTNRKTTTRKTSSQPKKVLNPPKVAAKNQIVEATGWIVDADGNIEFVAQANQAKPKSPWQNPASCSISK